MKKINTHKVCSRCNGHGSGSWYCDHGRCWACMGAGIVLTKWWALVMEFLTILKDIDSKDGFIAYYDNEMNRLNCRIEKCISENYPIYPNFWLRIENNEKKLNEYRNKFVSIRNKLRYKFGNVDEFDQFFNNNSKALIDFLNERNKREIEEKCAAIKAKNKA